MSCFQFVSCTNIEDSSFLIRTLVENRGDADYLILAGNISKFASQNPVIDTFLNYVCSVYKMVFYVPGPQEYTGGSMALGNTFCAELEKLHQNLHIFSQKKRSFLLERGEGAAPIRLIGAKLWGVQENIYKERGILVEKKQEPSKTKKNKKIKEKIIYEPVSEEVADYLYVNDSKIIQEGLLEAKKANELTIVITHGTPHPSLIKEELASDSKHYKLVTQVDRSLLCGDLSPDYWVSGAPTGRWKVEGKDIPEMDGECKTTFCVNPYNYRTNNFSTTYKIKL